ncbi:MAG: fimbria/pilus outer membrane usher protein [Beijerinckiaceae bacterium]
MPFNFDEPQQRIYFSLEAGRRLARKYSARVQTERLAPQVDPGILVNYSIFAGSVRDNVSSGLKFTGANVSVDARAFSSLGVIRQTGIAGTTLYNSGNTFLRLESTYSYSDPERMFTARAGDLITGGLPWTRPIRMGGIQVQRDFTLRSDLVTRPIPVVAGTAAVPSTVDVYVNGLKTYSRTVGSGPFNISDIQNLSGSGAARVVVRDATGREVEQTLQLNDAPKLLRGGFFDFSTSAGFARRDFGILANDYDRRVVGAATFRYGLSNWLTLEGHAEGGAGLINAGAGLVAGLGRFGSLQVAGSASRRSSSGTGFQIYADWHKRFNWLSVSLSSQRSFGVYEDLASVTAKYNPTINITAQNATTLMPVAATATSLRPPRALDRLSLSAPVWFDKGYVSVNLINAQTYEGNKSRIASLSYTRALPWKASLFVTAFADFGTVKNRGVYAGLSMPLYGGVFGTANVSRVSRNAFAAAFEATKPQPLEDNTYGFRLRETRTSTPNRMASASFRSSYGQIGAQVQQNGDQVSGSATLDGSIAVMGGGVFPGNKVDSSFAVVSAGKPGVPVMYENRKIGETNMFGKLLVPNLRPYDANRVAIDTSKLPVNYDAGESNRRVAPYRYAGVHVDFAKGASSSAAIVVFKGADGKPVQTGSRGKTAAGEEFMVGYDGIAYLRRLSANNTVKIDLGLNECTASFPYSPKANQQVRIENIVCR